MKKSYLLFIAAGLCCLAACNKEMENNETPESPESVKMITETINANLGADTKVTIADDGAFAWTAGENIAVHVSNGDSHKYVVTTSGASATAASASFTVSYEEGYSRDAFAIFPSTIVATDAANYGQSGMALDVTLPSEYTLDQVSGTTTPCPMIASNTGSGWEFYHLCGLLRLTVNSIPPTANKITVNFHGNKVYGAFSVDSPVTAGSSSIVTATGSANDEITITFAAAGVWRDGVDINLPLPTGDYTNITVKAFAGSSELLSVTRPVKVGAASYTISKAAGKKCTASLPAFSVADNVRVHIAKSNLQLTRPDTDKTWAEYQALGQLTWSFMDYPWSREKESDMTVDYGNKTDVRSFAWGTSGHNFNETTPGSYGAYYQPWNTADGDTRDGTDFGPKGTSVNLTGTFALGDWGKKIADNGIELDDDSGYGASSQWRLFTADESLYLFGKTENPTYSGSTMTATGDATEGTTCYTRRHNSWAMCTINKGDATNQTDGVIIVPDFFVNPTNVSVKWCSVSYKSNQFTSEQWALMEAAGAAFLPYAMRILRKSGGGITPGINISYWTSSGRTDSDYHAYALNFSGNYENVRPYPADPGCARRNGMSIRLVREIN